MTVAGVVIIAVTLAFGFGWLAGAAWMALWANRHHPWDQ